MNTLSVPFGHEAVCAHLQGLCEEGTLHHAYFLVGAKHVGKTAVIDFLTEILKPCEILRIEPLLTDSGKRSRVISVEQIRGLRSQLTVKNFLAGKRLVIINLASDLNSEAGNALLKCLEEPDEDTLFILCAHDEKAILGTLASRCHIVRLTTLSDRSLAKWHGDEACLEIAAGRPGVLFSLKDNDDTRMGVLSRYKRVQDLLASGSRGVGKAVELTEDDLELAEAYVRACLRRECASKKALDSIELYERILKARDYCRSHLPIERIWESLLISYA